MGQQVVSKYTKDDLFALIKDVMGIQSVTPMIQRQVNKFILEYDMTFKEIARCIVYYVEVRGGVLDTMYGLGIIPNIREQAGLHFKQL